MWITILTPLYNGVEFLEETIRSVQNQTEKEWTMVIGINGHGATGGVIAERVKKMIAAEARIQLVIQPVEINNKSKSLNHLVKNHVKTEWVAILDADDLWTPNKLEEQKRYIQNHPEVEVVGTQGEYFGTRTGNIPIHPGEITFSMLLSNNQILNSSAILKTTRASWNETMTLLEDYDLWLSLAKKKVVIHNLSGKYFRHRLHPKSHFNNQPQEHQVRQLRYYWKNI